MAHIDLNREWHIVSSSPDPTAVLAAHELSAVLRRVTGREVAVHDTQQGGRPAFLLSHGQGREDGFRWQVTQDGVELQGENPRGLLYAVYSLLEALGCRWVAPGKQGERLPHGARFELPDGAVEARPALPGRCLILGHYAFLRDAGAWIEWAARNRLNTIFAHVIDEPLALGAAPESQWQAIKEEVVPLARKRGMVVEHGGHGLAALLPRKLFKEMPEAFRFHDGKRTADHNFCPTYERGMAVIRRNAEGYFRAHPEVDVFHLWPDDIPGGGWCACERCSAYTPSEQALLAVNAIAEVLEEINPEAQIAFLAYMDTERVPERVTPRRNVCLSWAPRNRCYAHSTDDAGCAVNVPHYAETLAGQVAHFRAAGAQPARVFEYYLDAILFKSLLPPLPSVMQRDLRFYRDAGAHTVQALMTGDRPWLAAQVNAWLFARLCWDPEQDVDTLLAEWGRAVLGMDRAAGVGYVRALEAAFALALDVVPEQIYMAFGLGVKQMLDNPVADMGDPAFAPAAVLRQKCAENAAIEGLVAEAGQHLEAARERARLDAWAAERAELDLAKAWLRFDLARVRLYEALAGEQVTPEARQRLEEARVALGEVLAWGDAHLADRRFRRNFRGLHALFWGLRLETIRARFAAPWRRWAVKLGILLRLAMTMVGLRGLYER